MIQVYSHLQDELAVWDLELHSFGPDEFESNIQNPIVLVTVLETANKYILYKDPGARKITGITLDNIHLSGWNDLPASQAQLHELGV